MERIGVIGLGRMGSAIAHRMREQGHSVTGWTRSGRTVEGITTLSDLAAVIAQSDALILSLLNDDAVAEVLETCLCCDLTGKQIMGSMQMPTVHRGGDAKPLVFLTNAKPAHELYDNVPRASELGIDAMTDFFAGILAPAGTPQDRVDVIANAIEASLKEQEFIDLSNKFLVPLSYANSADFAEIITTVSAANKVEMKKLGLIE